MRALILAAVVGFGLESPIVSDTADVIELNHYYDEQGKLVFDQIIFWRWWDEEGAYHVMAWRFLKSPSQIPQRQWRRGGYVTIWYDGDQLRRVRAASGRETWTQYDPEVRDRQFLPQAERPGLAVPPGIKTEGPRSAARWP